MKTMMIALIVATATTASAHAQPPNDLDTQSRKLDTALFDAYNHCDLAAFGALLAPDIEFYHDKSGLMLGRQPVVDAVQKNICGKVRREPIEGTLTSYPMDAYGLLQLGEHRFSPRIRTPAPARRASCTCGISPTAPGRRRASSATTTSR